jgi:hypothetical protein
MCKLAKLKRCKDYHNPFLGCSPIHIFFSLQKILSKNITVKRGCQNILKMIKKWLRRFKITKIKI